MTDLRLVIFDVDGTLVDSQADILAAMASAFDRAGAPPPSRADILGIVGLSLEVAIPRLAPDLPAHTHTNMVDWYKDAYVALRAKVGAAESSPLYPHVRETLDQLHNQPQMLLGVATGKSRRGLDKLLEGHGLERMFVTQQVSDHHPSKPHPAMLLSALSETGLDAHQAIMVGDTVFDMNMATAAGMPFIGVSWGYHAPALLTDAVAILDDMRELPAILSTHWETAA
ncbi:MAG: HAD-IA family hydrolase [Pseudomonadota bacterium]